MKPLTSLHLLTLSATAASMFLLAGCCATCGTGGTGGTNPPSSSALCTLQDDNGVAIPANFAGTLGTVHRSHAANHVNEVKAVQSACCASYDRLIFAMDGIHQPTYTVQYAPPPFDDCGSGNAHNVPGNAFLTIKMKPAQGHGTVTIPRETSYSCPNLKHLSITCDFEADLTFVVGLSSKKPYRVTELQNPTRLVVDIKH